MAVDHEADKQEIGQIIADLFEAISWTRDSPPDWDNFAQPYLDKALLFPSARPVSSKTLEEFIAMMQGQYPEKMHTLQEDVIRNEVRVFGNLAMALSSYSANINGEPAGRGVNGFLFLRDDGKWKIGAMCWDNESEDNPLPEALSK